MLISVLIHLLVFGVIAWLIYYLLTLMPVPDPPKRVIIIVYLIVVIIIAITVFLLPMLGHSSGHYW